MVHPAKRCTALRAEPRHVSERYLRGENYLTAVKRPMEEQM